VLFNIETLRESKQHPCHSGGYSNRGSYLVPCEKNSSFSYSGKDVFKYRLVFRTFWGYSQLPYDELSRNATNLRPNTRIPCQFITHFNTITLTL